MFTHLKKKKCFLIIQNTLIDRGEIHRLVAFYVRKEIKLIRCLELSIQPVAMRNKMRCSNAKDKFQMVSM